MASEPGRDLDLGLLHARDRRFAFHRAGTGQPPDGFLEGELAPLTDFPFEFGVRLGSPRVLVVAHGLSASTTAGALAVRPLARSRLDGSHNRHPAGTAAGRGGRSKTWIDWSFSERPSSGWFFFLRRSDTVTTRVRVIQPTPSMLP